MNNANLTVCGVVEMNGGVLLVRHSYGSAKDKLVLPGGFVRQGELPTTAAEREIFEGTGITCKAKAVLSVQFRADQWCTVFVMEQAQGEIRTDSFAISEAVTLSPEEALSRPDLNDMSREILSAYLRTCNSEGAKALSRWDNSTNEAVFGV